MSDLLAGQAGVGGASDTSPAATIADIEKVKAEIASAFDERAKGFQRLLAGRDETIKALSEQLDELKTAGLSEDERVQLREQRLAEENEKLRTELELLELSREYGDEYPIFRELIDAPTAKDQLEAIRKMRKASVPAPSPAPAEEPETSLPDMNNPMRGTDGWGFLPDGTPMSDDLADRLLKSVSRVPWRRGQ